MPSTAITMMIVNTVLNRGDLNMVLDAGGVALRRAFVFQSGGFRLPPVSKTGACSVTYAQLGTRYGTLAVLGRGQRWTPFASSFRLKTAPKRTGRVCRQFSASSGVSSRNVLFGG